MFALHETTQRRVCRVLFVVLCVVPTVLTFVGIAYCNRPWRQQDWQRTLAEKFHLRAELEDISWPKPGLTVLSNLRFADLRADRRFGSMDRLTIQSKTSQLLLHAESVVIQADQLPSLATAISTWLATRDGDVGRWEFHAEKLTVASSVYSASTWSDFSLSNDLSDPRTVRFRARASNDADEPLQVLLERIDGDLRFAVDAQQTRLPAWLIGSLVPRIGSCGEASFTGLIALEATGQGTTGKLKGQLESVDLQEWISSSEIHRLVGMADIRFDQLEWSGSGLEVVQGAIKANTGAVSFSLLEAANRLFACVAGPGWNSLKPGSQQGLVSFDKLAITFRINQSGITFEGNCDQGAVVVADNRALLFGPQGKTAFPVAQLVNLFHRPRHGWMPDTHEAHSMARELPLPRKNTDKPQAEHK